jgi:hypothetical protein
MKKTILITLFVLLSNIAFSQSVIIYRTDQTSISFQLSEVDSITFSMTSFAEALDLSSWECMTTEPVIKKATPAAGVFEKVAEGLKIYGNDNQINQVVHLASISENPITDKTIYLKWKVDGSNNPVNVKINLLTDTTNWSSGYQALNLATGYSFDGSKSLSDGTWYFTRIVITSGTAVSITAIEDYNDNGGTIVQQLTTNLPQVVKTFAFRIKASKASYVLLAEMRIE